MKTARLMGVLLLALLMLGACAGKQKAPPVDPGVEMFEAGQYEEAREYYKAKLAENPADE